MSDQLFRLPQPQSSSPVSTDEAVRASYDAELLRDAARTPTAGEASLVEQRGYRDDAALARTTNHEAYLRFFACMLVGGLVAKAVTASTPVGLALVGGLALASWLEREQARKSRRTRASHEPRPGRAAMLPTAVGVTS
jgi:hypothetical protein